MNIPSQLKYAKSHEWVEFLPDGSARIGLTDHAQEALGDLVFVNLPQEGDAVVAGESFGDVESVKAVSDVYSPVSGTVVEVNYTVMDAPETINQDPYGAWFIRVVNASGQEGLMTAGEYEAFLAAEG